MNDTEKKPVYWSNLVRYRVMYRSMIVGLISVVLASFIGFGGGWLIAVFILMWIVTTAAHLHTQMACRMCGTFLRDDRMTGDQLSCHKCGRPTDLGAKKGLV